MTLTDLIHRIVLRFQSTPPREGVTGNKAVGVVSNTFQSTPPREGVTTSKQMTFADAVFQSTPPREGVTPNRCWICL